MSKPQPDKIRPGAALATAHGFGALLWLALLVTLVAVLARNHVPGKRLVTDLVLAGGLALLIALAGMLVFRVFAYPLSRMGRVASTLAAVVIMALAAAAATAALTYGLYAAGITAELWPEWFLSLLVRAAVLAALVAVLYAAYMAAHHRAQVESLSTESHKLQALQSRIRPHFLFNSMNSIAGMLKSDPDRAEHALQDLADVFRVLLADARKLVPITSETELARQYLEIEKIRLGDRLHYKWSTSNVPRSAQIPSLTLQPLLENAIYHGIESCFAGGTVNVEMWTQDDKLNIMISNPMPEAPSPKHRQGNKIAMDNIRQRLAQHFGDKAEMQAFEKTGIYFVKLSLPVIRG